MMIQFYGHKKIIYPRRLSLISFILDVFHCRGNNDLSSKAMDLPFLLAILLPKPPPMV